MGLADYIFLNRYATFPSDFLPVIPYTIGWGVIHWVLKDLIITPIAKHYVVEDQLAKEAREAALKAANAKANGTAETATATGAKTSVTEAVPRKGKQNGGTVSDGESKTKPPAKAKASSDDDDDDGGRLVEEKFGIASWNFFCHALLMIYGVYAVMGEPWIEDPRSWFDGWPESQTMSPQLFTLYYLFTGYYIYSFFDLFRQLRQRDFNQMIIHHSVSLFLLAFAFLFGFQRVGAVLMIYHEASDPFLELAKMFVYTGYQTMADLFFAAFALVFIVSRDILYPLHVIIPTWKYAPTEFPDGTPDPGLVYVIMAALLTLLALHVFWSSIILKMVVKAVRDGNVKGDVRDQHFDEVMIEEVEHAAN